MSEPTEEQLLAIAKKHLYGRLTTLLSRGNDNEDFFKVSVWGVKAALTEAFELGQKNPAGKE